MIQFIIFSITNETFSSKGGISYTMIYNLLNFPAGVVPVSRVTAADEENLKLYKGNFQDYMDKLLPQVTHKNNNRNHVYL